jgi:hypothetical protein
VDRKEAIDVFGLPGLNVDIPLVDDEPSIERLLSGTQAVILCCGFDCSGRRVDEEALLARRVFDTIETKNSDFGVKKIVCVSRVVPSDWAFDGQNSGMQMLTNLLLKPLTGWRRPDQAFHNDMERKTRGSGLDYVIVRSPEACDESREG